MTDYGAGLRAALVMAEDNIRDPQDRARIQASLHRAIAIAECDQCDRRGWIGDGLYNGDHHPLDEMYASLGVDQGPTLLDALEEMR